VGRISSARELRRRVVLLVQPFGLTQSRRGVRQAHNADARLRYGDIIELTGKETTDNAPCGSSGGRFGLGESFKAAIYNDGDAVVQIS
jgi:hypothetical protein